MSDTYADSPERIETKSLDLIDSLLPSYGIADDLFPLVRRVVHASADFSLANLVAATCPLADLAHTLAQGGPLFCDVSMVASGISPALLDRTRLKPLSLIHDERVARLSARSGKTRAMAAVDLAVDEGVSLFAFGNAPTALFRLLERAAQGAPVRAVVAMPVGFVGAAESKERLLASGLPSVVLKGPRGGSNLCAAAVNALIRLALDRR
ncbi:precorrin-8X methylmutase [Aminirod propionatiphilus]|uniref:Precorrin-8X methylmutase n=1 Tax=Aminirod propionatiphilus TaxID=3415223 RepID=A0ACD1DYI0_9BACT|nr:precorrin-8X methylmutase [Synergistota bacterium]